MSKRITARNQALLHWREPKEVHVARRDMRRTALRVKHSLRTYYMGMRKQHRDSRGRFA